MLKHEAWSTDTLAKDLITSVSLIKTGQKLGNLETTGLGKRSCSLVLTESPPSGKGGLKRIVLGALGLLYLLAFHSVHSREGTECPGGDVYLETPVTVSLNIAGVLCLSLRPDPMQSKMVWLFTEISHPVSKRKFKR